MLICAVMLMLILGYFVATQMRRFGGKQTLCGGSSISISHEDDDTTSRSNAGLEGGNYLPLEVAIQETCSKGSLLERIASLEDRLLQMCLEIESYKRYSSTSSSINTSWGASSSSNNESKRERMSSYPTFGYKLKPPQCKQESEAPYSISQFETPKLGQQQSIKALSLSSKRQPKPQGNKKDTKTGRKWKKGTYPSWPRLRILGC